MIYDCNNQSYNQKLQTYSIYKVTRNPLKITNKAVSSVQITQIKLQFIRFQISLSMTNSGPLDLYLPGTICIDYEQRISQIILCLLSNTQLHRLDSLLASISNVQINKFSLSQIINLKLINKLQYIRQKLLGQDKGKIAIKHIQILEDVIKKGLREFSDISEHFQHKKQGQSISQ